MIHVSNYLKQYYTLSLENRKSITIFECINAMGSYPPPLMILIERHEYMQSWFCERLLERTQIVLAKNGFTSNKIALVFLQHYIDNSNLGPEADWKIMLIDNHGSHCTPEFIAFANDNHIRPYPLIAHCMQPLM